MITVTRTLESCLFVPGENHHNGQHRKCWCLWGCSFMLNACRYVCYMWLFCDQSTSPSPNAVSDVAVAAFAFFRAIRAALLSAWYRFCRVRGHAARLYPASCSCLITRLMPVLSAPSGTSGSAPALNGQIRTARSPRPRVWA